MMTCNTLGGRAKLNAKLINKLSRIFVLTFMMCPIESCSPNYLEFRLNKRAARRRVRRMIDECDIEHIIKSREVGDDALKTIERFRPPDAQRFSIIGQMDWTGVERDEFIPMSLDCINRPV